MASIKTIRKIYSDGRHNAFTDIEIWKGAYYVTFRNSGCFGVFPCWIGPDWKIRINLIFSVVSVIHVILKGFVLVSFKKS